MKTFRILTTLMLALMLLAPDAPATLTAHAAAPAFAPQSGNWTGTTSRGYPMSFTVSGASLTNFKLKTATSVGGCTGTIETTYPGPVTIVGNSFSWSGSTFAFSGTFTSATTASGSYAWSSYYIYGCGYFSQSGTWTASVPPPPPGAFSKTSPASGTTGRPLSLTLSWAVAAGAASYEYCYDATNDDACDGSWVGTGAARSAAISGLSSSTTYYWQVRAKNGGGTTDANTGAWWSFTTGDPPGSFSKSAPSSGATNQPLGPTISWGAAAGATSYQYCYDTTNDNACSTWISAGANTSAVLSGLNGSTTYYWQARASSAFGTTYADGAATAFWSFTTGIPPSGFGKVAPYNTATGQPPATTLTWGSSPDALAYDYCFDTVNNNACDSSWISAGTDTTVDPPGDFLPGRTYYWQARALNSIGPTQADGGTWWSFSTIPPLTLTLRSTGAHDGWVLEKSENANLGATMNPSEPTFTLGDDTAKKQYRGILSFNTASIPAGAVVTGATLKIRVASASPVNPFTTLGVITVDVKKGAFGTTALLQALDWQAAPTKLAAFTIPNTPVSGWYSRALVGVNLNLLNRTGLTQFRLRFTKDDDNDGVSDFAKFYSGNFGTVTLRPTLVVQYYVP